MREKLTHSVGLLSDLHVLLLALDVVQGLGKLGDHRVQLVVLLYEWKKNGGKNTPNKRCYHHHHHHHNSPLEFKKLTVGENLLGRHSTTHNHAEDHQLGCQGRHLVAKTIPGCKVSVLVCRILSCNEHNKRDGNDDDDDDDDDNDNDDDDDCPNIIAIGGCCCCCRLFVVVDCLLFVVHNFKNTVKLSQTLHFFFSKQKRREMKWKSSCVGIHRHTYTYTHTHTCIHTHTYIQTYIRTPEKRGFIF